MKQDEGRVEGAGFPNGGEVRGASRRYKHLMAVVAVGAHTQVARLARHQPSLNHPPSTLHPDLRDLGHPRARTVVTAVTVWASFRPTPESRRTAQLLLAEDSYANDPCPDDRCCRRRGGSDDFRRPTGPFLQRRLVLGNQRRRSDAGRTGQAYKQAPFVGIEWLITRTHGGLYISGGEAFFKTQTLVQRDFSPDSGARIIVSRTCGSSTSRSWDSRASIALPSICRHRFTLNQIVNAVARPPFGTQDQFDATQSLIQDQKVVFSPLLIVGGQYALRNFSVFGHDEQWRERDFLILNEGLGRVELILCSKQQDEPRRRRSNSACQHMDGSAEVSPGIP